MFTQEVKTLLVERDSPSLLFLFMPGCCPLASGGLGLRPFFFILGGKPMSPRKKSSAEEEEEGEAVDGAAPMPEDTM